jgi:hypothetical protein
MENWKQKLTILQCIEEINQKAYKFHDTKFNIRISLKYTVSSMYIIKFTRKSIKTHGQVTKSLLPLICMSEMHKIWSGDGSGGGLNGRGDATGVTSSGPGSSSGGGFRGGLCKGATKACGALIRVTWFPRKTVSPSILGPF